MYQLILHHIYRNGPYAIDISGAHNDGVVTAVSHVVDGASAGSGALVFNSSASRVRVPLNSKGLFNHVFALKIEINARLDALGQRRNLVEGDGSFAFFIDPEGYLWGTYNGPQYLGGPPIWHGANSRDNSPAGLPFKVPLSNWVTLRYEHDGYASIRLYVDDVLVAANYSLQSGIPPVVNTGINIGNWTLNDAYPFNGAIDEVKIWRWDPDDAWGHFLGRPMDRCTAPCWGRFFDWFAEKLKDPQTQQQMINLLQCLGAAQTEMVRLLRSKGEDAIAQNSRFSDEYRHLWQQRPLNSAAMKDWQRRWFEWLIATVGEPAWKQFQKRVQRCLIASGILERLPVFDCDVDFARYLMDFSGAIGNPFGDQDSFGKGGKNGTDCAATN